VKYAHFNNKSFTNSVEICLILINKLCATLSANVNIYYRICTFRQIRIEIIHGSQNVFWVLTWVGRILVNWNKILNTGIKARFTEHFLSFAPNAHLYILCSFVSHLCWLAMTYMGTDPLILKTYYMDKEEITCYLRNDFRTDLHKMKINTELCYKRYDFLTKKTQNYRYQNYCLDDNIQIYSIWSSMWTRLEHAHCLETINNMW
jgi:hypothetical protein